MSAQATHERPVLRAHDEPPRFDEALAPLRDALARGLAPGAQLSVRHRDGAGRWRGVDLALGALDGTPERPGERAVATSTLFDLASVTKALFALCAVRASARGALDLAAPLGALWPAAQGRPTESVTLDALLAHRAQLPAWRPHFQRLLSFREAEREGRDTRALLLDEGYLADALEPTAREGEARYSDVGYVLAGEAATHALGHGSLRSLLDDELRGPLSLGDELAYRGAAPSWHSERCAATERCAWRGDAVLRGRVHDENAFALGGVAAHAGLFGTARAVAAVGCAALDALEGEDRWFAPRAMRAMCAPRAGGSHRLGWDGRSEGKSSAGASASALTFGHLGFTGTSVWCDPTRAGLAVLLTNRVHPTREKSGIFELRAAVYDAVWRALDDARGG